MGHGQIGRRRLLAAAGVVVGQDDAGGLVAQGRFDNQSGVNRSLIDGALMEQAGLVNHQGGVEEVAEADDDSRR